MTPAAWFCVALEANGLLVLHPPGTQKRQALFNEFGERIRGKDNKEAAPVANTSGSDWTVAQVCEIYLADLTITASPEWVVLAKSWFNNTQRNVIACIKAAFNFYS